MNSQAIDAVSGTASLAPPESAAVQNSGPATKKNAANAGKQAERRAEESVAVPTRDSRSVKYWVDGESRQVVTAVIDDRDMTVIRQIPDEEIVRIAKAIDRMQGFLIDSKV